MQGLPGWIDDGLPGGQRGRWLRLAAVMAGAVLAVTLLGLLLSSPPGHASHKDNPDWKRTEQSWLQPDPEDPGGSDAVAGLSYSTGNRRASVFGEFRAWGEHVYVWNSSTRHRAKWRLKVPGKDPSGYIKPGKRLSDGTVRLGCVTWGWQKPPKKLASCKYLGDPNIRDDRKVTLEVCVQTKRRGPGGVPRYSWFCARAKGRA